MGYAPGRFAPSRGKLRTIRSLAQPARPTQAPDKHAARSLIVLRSRLASSRAFSPPQRLRPLELPPPSSLYALLRSLFARRFVAFAPCTCFGSLRLATQSGGSSCANALAVSDYPTPSVTSASVMFFACVALSRAAKLRPALHLRHGRSTPCVLHCPCSQAARGQ